MVQIRESVFTVSRAVLFLCVIQLHPILWAQETEGNSTGTAQPVPRSRTIRTPPEGGRSVPSPQRMATPPPSAVVNLPGEIAPARFEVAVYEVRLPEARVTQIEAPALEAKAATVESLAKALAEFGDTHLLYKIDQSVNLHGETIRMGTQKPVITGTRMVPSGGAINSVTYQEVGLIVKLAAALPAPESARGNLVVQLDFELSVPAESGVEIAPSVSASETRQLQLSHGAAPRNGRPVVLLSVNAGTGDKEVLPTAYVIRYVFHEPVE